MTKKASVQSDSVPVHPRNLTSTAIPMTQNAKTFMPVIAKELTGNPRLANNELTLPDCPLPGMSSLFLCPNPVSHSHSVITTSNDLEPFHKDESYNPISYTRDVKNANEKPG